MKTMTTEERTDAISKLFTDIIELSRLGNEDGQTHVTVATLQKAKQGLVQAAHLKRALIAENIPPCDCGYSKSDSMTNHHEECAYVQYGRKHKLEVVAVDQRTS